MRITKLVTYLTWGIFAMASPLLHAETLAQRSVTPTPQMLTLKVYNNPDPKGFQVSSTLVMGKKEAILFDAQFTQSDAHRLVAELLESGKNLTTVFVTEGDPDYYFGLNVIQQAFPKVKFLTTTAVAAHIKETVAKKLAVWGPQLGNNGPASTVIPEVLNGDFLELEGQRVEVRYGVGLKKDSAFIWIPSTKTVLGGVLIFSNLHVWTAYANPTKEMRMDWIRSLDKITALKPEVVIPGHMQAGSERNISSVIFTREYLATYEKEVAKSKNSSELIAAMKKNYPSAGLEISLNIGAKVSKDEMIWE